MKWFLFIVLCGVVKLASGQDKVEVISYPENCPITAKRDDALAIHFTGFQASDTTKVVSSYDRAMPVTVQLGKGRVIDQGLLGMCKGEKRKWTLKTPSKMELLKYVPADSMVPDGTTMYFEVELIDILGGLETADIDADTRVSKTEFLKYRTRLFHQSLELIFPKNGKEEILPKEFQDVFNMLDTDEDGYVSTTEATDYPNMKEVLQKFDFDQDSKLSKAELVKFAQEDLESQMLEKADEDFHKLDANKDGYINQDEGSPKPELTTHDEL